MDAGIEHLKREHHPEQDLALQGFAVLDLELDVQSLESCQRDAGSLRRHLRSPPEELLDSFLGRRGSARCCEIPFDGPPSRRVRLESLRGLSRKVETAVASVDRLSHLGCILHETGTWDRRSAPPLQESDVEKWLPRLMARTLTAIVALGPAPAEVELQCLSNELAVVEVVDEEAVNVDAADTVDSEKQEESEDEKPPTKLVSTEFPSKPHRITLHSGRVLLVRSNLVWQTLAGDAGDFVISWMFGRKPEVDWSVLNKSHGSQAPGLLQLRAWLNKRLEQRKESQNHRNRESEASEWRVMVPYVYKLKAPRTPTSGAARLEVFSKGEVVLGAVESVDGSLWLKTQSGQAVDGQPVTGYIAIEAETEQAIQPVKEFLPAWQSLSAHMPAESSHQIIVRAASCKFATTHQVRQFWPPHLAGADFCVEVPLARWDHANHFSEDGSESDKALCKHGAFMDGAELFDNKRFQISAAEVISMDPQQRMALECAEEAFFNMGLTREMLSRSVSGVYVGAGMHEWPGTPNCARDPAADMYSCTGGSTAIHSNRISFNLGLMGPSLTVICEGASSLLTLERGFVSLDPQKSDNVRALSMGVSTMLVPSTWVHLSQQGVMWHGGLHGRCKAFAHEATGYVRGEGCGCVVQEVLHKSDGSDENFLGALRSACSKHQPIAGLLDAPSGPAEQLLVSETLRRAQLDPLSIDAIDCNAEGRQLCDAIETAAISDVLCPSDVNDSQIRPLTLTSCKSSQAHCLEAAGMCALLRILMSTNTGCHVAPNQHLYTLNPILCSTCEFDDFLCQAPTELVKSRSRDSVIGVKGHSIAGTMGLVLASVTQRQPKQREAFSPATQALPFWPAGNVPLPAHADAQKGYELLGSWNGWQASVQMMRQGTSGREHVWAAEIPVAAGGLVSFQILLDGDPEKILHPGCVAAGPNTRVLGPHPPSQVGHAVSWCIAATQEFMCQVELHISGSWRAVSWFQPTSSQVVDKQLT